MDLKELLRKRAQLLKDCRELNDLASKENRAFSAEEDTRYNKMFNDATAIGADIKREETLREAERAAEHTGETRKAAGLDVDVRAVDAEKRYTERVRPIISKFFSRGAGGLSAEDVTELRAVQADLNTSGGYMKMPQQFVRTLIKNVDDLLFIRPLATKYTLTESDSLGAPSLTADPSDAAWTGEITTVSDDSTMAFGKRELKPHPLKKLIKASNKLLRLSPDAEALVRDRLAYVLAKTQEKAFLTGNGAGQPLGVFTASDQGVPTSRDVSTDNTGTEIAADNLIECKYTLKAQYHARAQWVGHRDWVKKIAKLKDSEGQYIWREGLVAGEPDRLLGLPINMSENAPSTFTTGQYVAVLGDFSHYWIADVLNVDLQVLLELYAITSQTGFKIETHCDGMPVLAEAFVRSKMG